LLIVSAKRQAFQKLVEPAVPLIFQRLHIRFGQGMLASHFLNQFVIPKCPRRAALRLGVESIHERAAKARPPAPACRLIVTKGCGD
jgi:hypothetical protein